MATDEKDRFIQYLVDRGNTYELDKRATELAVEEFQSTFDTVSVVSNIVGSLQYTDSSPIHQ